MPPVDGWPSLRVCLLVHFDVILASISLHTSQPPNTCYNTYFLVVTKVHFYSQYVFSALFKKESRHNFMRQLLPLPALASLRWQFGRVFRGGPSVTFEITYFHPSFSLIQSEKGIHNIVTYSQ